MIQFNSWFYLTFYLTYTKENNTEKGKDEHYTLSVRLDVKKRNGNSLNNHTMSFI